MGLDSKERLQSLLDLFVGTNNYHNFTRRLHGKEGSAKRLIHGMKMSNVVMVDDVEYLEFEIHGAAFLYHQIRKMMGLLAVMMRRSVYTLRSESGDRRVTAEDELKSMAFSPRYKMSIPLAPAQGLYLKEVRFDAFNEKVVGDGQSWKEIKFQRWSRGIDHFVNHQIVPSIVQNADEFALWLYALEKQWKFEILEITGALSRKRAEEGHRFVTVGVPNGWRAGLCHGNSRIAHSVQSRFLRDVLRKYAKK